MMTALVLMMKPYGHRGLSHAERIYNYRLSKTRAAFILILRRQNHRFETPIQNAVHGGTVYAYLEKKTIS